MSRPVKFRQTWLSSPAPHKDQDSAPFEVVGLPCARDVRVQLEQDLSADPQDLDTLKFVLKTIADVADMGMDVELKYLDTMERYRTLRQYSIAVSEGEQAQAEGIADRWRALVARARAKDACLGQVKDRFREVTRNQVLAFRETLKDLERNFRTEGPGNADVQLDDGVQLLAAYHEKVQVRSQLSSHVA